VKVTEAIEGDPQVKLAALTSVLTLNVCDHARYGTRFTGFRFSVFSGSQWNDYVML
jgi:hypothetical protein